MEAVSLLWGSLRLNFENFFQPTDIRMQHPASRHLQRPVRSQRSSRAGKSGREFAGFILCFETEYNTFGGNSARIRSDSSTDSCSPAEFAMLRVAEFLNADKRFVLRIRGLTRWYHFILSDEFQIDLPLFGPSDDPSRTFQSLWTCECPS